MIPVDPNDYIDAPEDGAQPSDPDHRDWPLLAAVPDGPSTTLPPAYRVDRLPVVNQGHTSTCVGQSGAMTRTITERLVDGHDLSFDGYELYNACKQVDNHPSEKGTSIRVALKLLKARGAQTLATPPTLEPISGFVRVKTQVDEIKTALVNLGHVWVALRWCDEWNHGPLKHSNSIMGQPQQPSIGHATTLVGYDDSIDCGPLGLGAYRVHNSFGRGWGDNGEAWLPYSLTSRLWEAWTTFAIPEEPAPKPTPDPAPDPAPVPTPDPAPAPDGAPEPPTPPAENAVKLLTEIVPGQIGSVTGGPILDPSTLAPVTTFVAADAAKIIGHTSDGAYYGVLVNTQRVPGPDPKLLLVSASRVSNLRVAPAADTAKLEQVIKHVQAAKAEIDSALSDSDPAK